MIRRKFLFPIVFSAAFIAVVFSQAKASPRETPPPLHPKQLELLNSPERVESYRLIPMPFSPRLIPKLMVSKTQGFDINSQGPDLERSQIEEIRALFSRERSYRKSVKTDCSFSPGVGLKFVKGNESLILLFCFACNEWAFLDRDNRMNYSEFGSDQVALIRLAKELFPQDAKIQALGPSCTDLLLSY